MKDSSTTRLRQSNLSTIWRGKMGIYESRIILKVVEKCQVLLPKDTKPITYNVPSDFDLALQFTIGELTPSHNYAKARTAIKKLMTLVLEHYDEQSNTWVASPLFTEASCDLGTGNTIIKMKYWVAREIVDFKRGWVTFNLDDMGKIKRPNTARLYALMCSAGQPLTYRVDTLRHMLFGTKSKEYEGKPSDFVRKILMTASKELENLGLNGFDVTPVKAWSKCRTAPITHVTLTPVKREQHAETRTLEQIGRQEMTLRNYLATQFNFTPAELRGNKKTLTAYCHLPNWMDSFQKIVERTRRKRAGHGYIINAIKNEIYISHTK